MTGWKVFPWQTPKIYRLPNFYFLIQFMLKIIFQKELFSSLQKVKHVSNCCKKHFPHFNSSTKSTQTFLGLCHVFLPHERLLKLGRITWRAILVPRATGINLSWTRPLNQKKRRALGTRMLRRQKKKSASGATHSQTIVYFKTNPRFFFNLL